MLQVPETDGHLSQFLCSSVVRSKCLRRRTFSVLQNFSKNFITNFQFVLRWTSILHVRYSREEDQEDSCTSKFVAWPHNNGSEKSVYRLDAWIRKATQHISSLFFGGTTNAVAIQETLVTYHWSHGRLRASLQRFQSSSVSILTFQQLTECTLRRHRHLYMQLLFFS